MSLEEISSLPARFHRGDIVIAFCKNGTIFVEQNRVVLGTGWDFYVTFYFQLVKLGYSEIAGTRHGEICVFGVKDSDEKL